MHHRALARSPVALQVCLPVLPSTLPGPTEHASRRTPWRVSASHASVHECHRIADDHTCNPYASARMHQLPGHSWMRPSTLPLKLEARGLLVRKCCSAWDSRPSTAGPQAGSIAVECSFSEHAESAPTSVCLKRWCISCWSTACCVL